MQQTLILAWGNPGRLDDGLGPELARVAAGWGMPDVRVKSGYQLQIEDAHEAAGVRRVVFVDASRLGSGAYHVERLEAAEQAA